MGFTIRPKLKFSATLAAVWKPERVDMLTRVPVLSGLRPGQYDDLVHDSFRGETFA